MADTLATEAWLLVRVKDDRVEVLGIFKSKEIAEKNCVVMREWLEDHWQVHGPVQLMGWGFVEETGRMLSAPPISFPSHELH